MLTSNINQQEFVDRRNKCKDEAIKLGFKGLMVWSRGGGSFDRYADNSYLANHYQQRCFLPDFMPLWSGRSHCCLLIPAAGEPVLVVSSPEYNPNLVTVKDVRYHADFSGEICKAMKELKMDQGQIGLFGTDVMTHDRVVYIGKNLPKVELVPADDILTNVRVVKSARELDAIRKVSKIGSKAVDLIMSSVAPGKTEAEVLSSAMEYIISQGAALYFTVASSGETINSAHSLDFPGYDGSRKLKEGEFFRFDLIIVNEGYISDFGRTTVVGNKATAQQKEMMEKVTNACEYLISCIKPGMSITELVKLGNQHLLDNGVSLDTVQTDPSKIYAAYPPHWGHSLGMTWERPWFIEEEDFIIQENMYIAIEKSLYSPALGTTFFEQNIIVGKDGVELVSTSKTRWF